MWVIFSHRFFFCCLGTPLRIFKWFDCLLFVLGLVALGRGCELRLAAVSVRIQILLGYHDVSCYQLPLVLPCLPYRDYFPA